MKMVIKHYLSSPYFWLGATCGAVVGQFAHGWAAFTLGIVVSVVLCFILSYVLEELS